MSLLTCVVTHNRLEYTKRCIASWRDTVGPDAHLVVVDNASTDGTRGWLTATVEHVILNDSNRYPGAACNQGWDYGLARWDVALLHRSDNDIEYLPGWLAEVERTMAEWPEVALLGVLNLHEDRRVSGIDDAGIEPVHRVGGNVVLRARDYRGGMRWIESPWTPGGDEDGPMSWAAAQRGGVVRLRRTVANNMAFGRFWDFPDYYRATAKARGIADAEHSV